MQLSCIRLAISLQLAVLAVFSLSAMAWALTDEPGGAIAKIANTDSKAPSIVSNILMPLVLDSEGSSVTPESGQSLFQLIQMEYQGAFRLDSGRFGGDDTRYSVNYAVGTLAYNPKNHSLFIAGHSQASRVAEFSIPEPGMQTTVADLPVSSPPIQNFTSVFPATNEQEINRITGMLIYEDALIVNAEQWYDAAGNNTDTTFVVADADDLGGIVDGFYRLDGRANSAGYMGDIPAELQALFGGAKYYSGWSSVYSIVSRYSYGPSLWTFDPDDLVNTSATESPNINATAQMNFAYSSELRDELDDIDPNSAASPLWNILTDGFFGFFVPGTRSFAVIGSSGGVNSGIGYKITQTNGNLCGGYCSVEPDDNYNYFWLYDVEEILNAENVDDPRPFAYGKLDLPFDDNGAHGIIGGTIDVATKTLYIALANAGQVGTYDRPPLILTYSLD